MKLNPLVLQWSILLISLLLALVPSSSASAAIFEYHITTLTQQHSHLSPAAHDLGNAAPAAAADLAPGPAEDMQAVYTSATNLIIAKTAVLKLGRALTTDELALSAQALAQKLQLGQKEMLEIGGLVEVLVGGWNGRRGGEGGWRDDLKGDGQQGRSGHEEFSERWDRFVESLTAKQEHEGGCTL